MRSLKELLETGEKPTHEEARVYGAIGNCEKSFLIEARDIPDAWFQCVDLAYKEGNIQPVTAGSFGGEGTRKQIFNINGIINFPGTRPLEPNIPEQYNLPPPVKEGYIENHYIRKLLDASSKEPNEDYVYAEWIEPLYHKVVERFLSDGFGTNQMYIPVGDTKSFDLKDPPCLRGIDVKIVNQKLNYTVYFRSWDLWNGFPANLGGIQIMKELMVEDINKKGRKVEDGKLKFSSSGLHLYDYVWELAKIRLNLQS